MANEEVLRLRTTVVSEESLANLRALGREIGVNLPQHGKKGAKELETGFKALTESVKGFGEQLTKIVPGLEEFGLGAASATLGAVALVKTLTSISGKIVELQYASKELGMSERDLRAWGLAAEKAGIAPQEMIANLKSFRDVSQGFKYNIGGVRDELVAMGAGPVVARIMNARTETDKLKQAFDFKEALMKADPSGYQARKFFEMMGLGADAARLSFEGYQKAREHIKPLTLEEQAQAKRFHDDMILLGHGWEQLLQKTAIRLFPAMAQDIKDVEAIIGLLDKIDAFVDRHSGGGDGDKGGGNLMGRIVSGLLGTSSTGSQTGPARRAAERRKRLGLPPQVRPPAADEHEDGEEPAGEHEAPAAPAGAHARPEHHSALQSGFKLASYSDGFGASGANLSEFSKAVKDGVFAALVDFKSYVETGGAAAGGGTGMMNASFGGSAGAAAGGGAGAAAGALHSGGGYTVIPEGAAASPTGGRRHGGGGGGAAETSDAVTATDTADASKTGNAFLASQRARLKKEMDDNPELKKRFAAIIQRENPTAGKQVAESAMNRAIMTGRSMASILGGGAKSFYGPVRHGLIEPTMRSMSAKDLAARYGQIDAGLAGGNTVRGATDQGSRGDPNFEAGGQAVPDVNRERFGYWGGHKGVAFSRRWAQEQQAHVNASRIDSAVNNAATGGTKVEGSVNLTVNSNGTAAKTSANADGLWQRTTIQNYKQMQKTEAPPAWGG